MSSKFVETPEYRLLLKRNRETVKLFAPDSMSAHDRERLARSMTAKDLYRAVIEPTLDPKPDA